MPVSYLEELKAKRPALKKFSDKDIISLLPEYDRSAFGGLTPEEVQFKATDTRGQLRKGLSSGVDTLQALGGGLLGISGDAIGSDSLRDKGLEIYESNMREVSLSPPNSTFTEIAGPGDAFDWAVYTLGNLAPMMVTSVFGGVAGGLVAKTGAKALVERLVLENTAKGLVKEAAEKAAGVEAAKLLAIRESIGKGTGAYISSAGMEIGGTFGDTQDAAVSAIHGAIGGSFDALPITRILKRFGLSGKAKEAVETSVIKEMLVMAPFEGGTEALQGLVQQHAKYWVENEGKSLLTDLGAVDIKSLIEEGAAGALGGFVFGGAASLAAGDPIVSRTKLGDEPKGNVFDPPADDPPGGNPGAAVDSVITRSQRAADQALSSGADALGAEQARADALDAGLPGAVSQAQGLARQLYSDPAPPPPPPPTGPSLDELLGAARRAGDENALVRLDAVRRMQAGSDRLAGEGDTKRAKIMLERAQAIMVDVASKLPAPVPTEQVSDPAAPTEAPIATWTGRRGDGYPTMEAAQTGLAHRQTVRADLNWAIEPFGERFQLAGYSTQASGKTRLPQASEDAARVLDSAASSGRRALERSQDPRQRIQSGAIDYALRSIDANNGVATQAQATLLSEYGMGAPYDSISDPDKSQAQPAVVINSKIESAPQNPFQVIPPTPIVDQSAQQAEGKVTVQGIAVDFGSQKMPLDHRRLLTSQEGIEYGLQRVIEGKDTSGVGKGNRYKGKPNYGFNLPPQSKWGHLTRSDGEESSTPITEVALTSEERAGIADAWDMQDNRERYIALQSIGKQIALRLQKERVDKKAAILPVDQATQQAPIAKIDPVIASEPTEREVAMAGMRDSLPNTSLRKQSTEPSGIPVVETPVVGLRLSKDVPQFKSDAGATGVVDKLEGKYDRALASPIQVWERLDGTMEVISGRHRLDLAQRSNESTVPAQIHREADGFTAEQAHLLDTELNVKDGRGKVKDYVNYFKALPIERDEASQQGLLQTAVGKNAFAIANAGSDELIASHGAAQITDQAAVSIAQAAPNDARLQSVGIRLVLDGKSITQAANTMLAVKLMSGEGTGNASEDMFGFDDSAMQDAESMAKIASSKQRALSEQIASASGAAKRPDTAANLGVKVADPEATKSQIATLKTQQVAWNSWPTNPALVAEIRAEMEPRADLPADAASQTQSGMSDIFSNPPEPDSNSAQRQGKVGEMFTAGEVVTTSSGRSTTPFPKIGIDTKRKAASTIKRVDQWLMDNAIAEAKSRGDKFNIGWMESNRDKPSQSDKDSAEEYLFGEQPPVLPSILKPLVPSNLGEVSDIQSEQGEAANPVAAQRGMESLSDTEYQEIKDEARYLKDVLYSATAFDGVTPKQSVDIGTGIGNKSGRDTILMARYNLTRSAAHDFNNSLDELRPRKLRPVDIQDALRDFPTLKEKLDDALGVNGPHVVPDNNAAPAAIESQPDSEQGEVAKPPKPSTQSLINESNIPSADKIRLAADLRRGDVTHDDVVAVLSDAVQPESEVAQESAPVKKQYRYAMRNRPVGIGTAPKDFISTEPRPGEGEPHYEMARNGVAVYDRKLTDEETKNFEMSPMVEGEGMNEYADAVIEKMGRYASKYAEMDADEFSNEVADKLSSADKGYRPSLNIDDLASLVKKRIESKNKASQEPAGRAIEDFGEKITGAKKDVWASYKKKADASLGEEIATAPLSKSWPEPDYQQLLDDGMEPWAVAFAHTVRDQIPTKPKLPGKVKRWAANVESLRSMAYRILDNTDTSSKAKELIAEMVKDAKLLAIDGIVDLYMTVGHQKSLKGVTFKKHSYSIYNGQTYKPAKELWAVEKSSKASAMSNWPRQIAVADTREEAIEIFKSKLGELDTSAENQVSFSIYSKGREKGFYIGKKVGRNYIDLEKFDDVKLARAYLNENKAALIEKLAKRKEIPSLRRDSNNPRVGEDMRAGQDVTQEMFAEAFGFRGVQFGNWVEGKRRQQDLNDAYDALMDMAAILEIPPKAISLNGQLGLAFGARGSGGVEAGGAHYERNNIVINLTKKSGAGSLGHEWWHALDNYFSRMRKEPEDMMTEARDVGRSSSGTNYTALGEVRKEMIDAYGRIVSSIRSTAIKARSSKLDGKRSKDYWSTNIEMSARAFESYLISKLQDQNASNDYLANIVDADTWRGAESMGFELDESYPYPTAGEIPGVRAAFDEFFTTIESKETDTGVALFSRNADSSPDSQDPQVIIYSALARGIEGIDSKSMPGAMWKARIRGLINKGAAKADEVEWTGINEFLDMQEGKVSKAQVLEYLEANGVQVKDTVLGLKNVYPPDSYLHPDTGDVDTLENWRGFAEDMSDEGGLTTEEQMDELIDMEGEVIPDEGMDVKFAAYQLPGGTNYREVLLTLPNRTVKHTEENVTAIPSTSPEATQSDLFWYFRGPDNVYQISKLRYPSESDARQHVISNHTPGTDSRDFQSVHFDKPNILASIRMNDRVDTDGNRVLFIEEIQSDWAQEGRRKGFDTGEVAKLQEEKARIEGLLDALPENTPDTERLRVGGGLIGIQDSLIRLQRAPGIPSAPFVGKTDAWVALSIKRIIKMAIDEGYSSVAFINGTQSADRYDLSKQINMASAIANKDGTYNLIVEGLDKEEIAPYSRSGKKVTPAEMEEVVGKDLANKLIEGADIRKDAPWPKSASSNPAFFTVRGIDLKVGGEGMIAFYDKIVPKVAKDVLKKLGGGGLTTIKFDVTGGDPRSRAMQSDATPDGVATVSGFTITPSMASKAKSEGLPLFSKRRASSVTIPIDRASAFISAITGRLDNAPETIVVQNMQDSRVPEAVRKEDAKQRSQGATGEPEGFYYQGKAYIVLDGVSKLKGESDAQALLRVFSHEVLGHAGLRGLFRGDLDKVLNEVSLKRRSDMKRKAAEYGLDLSNRQDRLTAAEEVLAEMAQSEPSNSMVTKAVEAVRQALRKLFMALPADMKKMLGGIQFVKWVNSLTDAEMIDRFIVPARRFIQSGNNQEGSGIPVFQRAFHGTPQTNTPAFKKWFGDSKVVDANGEPMVVYHGSAGDFNTFDGAKASTASMHATAYIGHYFSVSPEVASSFVPQNRDMTTWPNTVGPQAGGNVMPVYLAIKNPYEMSIAEFRAMVPGGRGRDGIRQSEAIRAKLESEGHDGIRIPGDLALKDTMAGDEWSAETWIAFEPTQIKSAIGNDGNFDANNSDIRFSRDEDASLELESQSSDEIIAQESQRKRDAEKARKAEKAADDRDRADRDVDSFSLSGSDAESDKAASRGQMPLFSRSNQTGFGIPDETLTSLVIRKMQDKFKVLKDLQASIEQSGGNIDEKSDAYRAEEAFHGKAENDLRLMTDMYIEPLAKKMAKFDIDRNMLDKYLYSRHARERNAYIASINPKMPDGGSGMTNAQADMILSQVASSGKQGQFDQLAGIVYDMLKLQREMIRDGGLESDALIDAWQDQYKNYVPLKGFADDTKGEGIPRSGKGFNIGGKESKRALGRSSEAASPTSYAIVDLTEKIIRRRKNEVGNALLKLIQDNPNKELWEVFSDDNPDTTRTIKRVKDPATGQMVEQVIDTAVPMAMIKDQYFSTKKGGKVYYMKFKDQDDRLMRAMQNLGPESNNAFIRTMASVTRIMSALNTSYSPEFLISNFSRDVQTAILNLQAEQSLDKGKAAGTKIATQTVKDIPIAMRAIYASLRGKKLTGKAGVWQQDFDRFRADGAKTGWFDMKDLDGQAKEIDTMVSIAKGGFKGNAMRYLKSSANLVENMNQAVENAVRLSAYVNAVNAGIPRSQAASLAKNMTVNFNRRGEVGTLLNATYMFANASIQGTANFVRTMGTLKGDKKLNWKNLNNAQKIAIGITSGAYFLAMANRESAGDDEDDENWYDKVPDYVKERNIVIMKSLFGGPQDGAYWKIPLPYGFNVFSVLGTSVEGAMNGNKSVPQSAASLSLAALGSFSPIGFQQSQTMHGGVLKNITPTVLKPSVDVSLNENFMGSSIYTKNFPFGTPKPESSLGRRFTPEAYKAFAQWMNESTGGTEYRPGAVDVNPDVMQYFLDYFGGSAYSFFGSKLPDFAYRSATGVPIEPSKTPFISRISGRVTPYADTDKFYKRRDEINQIKDEYRSLPASERFEYQDRDKLKLLGVLDNTEKRLTLMRKRRTSVYSSDISIQERDARLKIIEAQIKATTDRFNKAYNAIEQ